MPQAVDCELLLYADDTYPKKVLRDKKKEHVLLRACKHATFF